MQEKEFETWSDQTAPSEKKTRSRRARNVQTKTKKQRENLTLFALTHARVIFAHIQQSIYGRDTHNITYAPLPRFPCARTREREREGVESKAKANQGKV